MPAKRKMDLDQFAADVCVTISEIGVWPSFLAAMRERGYTEKEVDGGITAIGKRIGMEI